MRAFFIIATKGFSVVECLRMAHTWIIGHENELVPIVRTVLGSLTDTDHAHILALKGDLGAGKTTFTQTLARELGIHEHVTSPTFVIMKSYPVQGHRIIQTLTHIDAYRIEDEIEMNALGYTALIHDPHRLIVIEWPERILGMIPSYAHTLSFSIQNQSHRIVTYGD
jgi:tRNA threonylcarbamoyladenosine biosynthesis protein TsaE